MVKYLLKFASMIDLIAFSCSNIWPFRDKAISVFFEQGKFLIKAPIGTGKSFLFFDGPLYALYKASSRNILNVQSSEWFIKLIFAYNGEQYLVIRQLSKAKTKESCTSKLYKITGNLSFWEEQKEKWILEMGDTVEKRLRSTHTEIEEISFKNETDLQQTLQTVLSPKEVFLNTVFLMQDSDNIFELQPAERLTVLKNVFGLMGIDEAKEVVGERRKEVNYKLKAYNDTSKYDEKLKLWIASYSAQYDRFFAVSKELKPDHTILYNSEIDELKTIQDKLTITNLETDIFSLDITWEIDGIIQTQKTQYQTLTTQETNKSEEIKKITNEIDTKSQQIFSIQKANEELIKNINSLNPELIEKLKAEKNQAITEQDQIEKSVPQNIFTNFLNTPEFEEFKPQIYTMQEYYNISQNIINLWKSLQESIQTLEAKIKNKELESAHKKTVQEQELKNLQDQKESLETQLKQIQTTLKDFDENIAQQATYTCEKIQGDCPFIKQINKKTFDQLDLQKTQFINQEKTILEKIQLQESLIFQKKNEILTGTQTTQDSDIQNRKDEIIKQQNKINIIKVFLTEIQRKDLQEKYTLYQSLQTKIREQDKAITTQELLSKERENYQQQKEKNEWILESLNQDITKLRENKTIVEKEREIIVNNRNNISVATLTEWERLSTQIKTHQRDIQNLIKDFKNIQTEINQLIIEEKQLNQLYQILSKELALLILQDHLPILNDIINTFLSQVVDYQINLNLVKTSSDRIELEANIIDTKGEREIKSLSGGQKIILKLVWMLAISAYMNSPILFLDETINNLDNDTVGKVAGMLEDTVKQRSIKIYTVTHNQQIQEMNIRDKTIELGSLLGVKET